jgi:5-methylcytosine-specific restriction endonuclease McrA
MSRDFMNYKDMRWIHKRSAILRRDEYLCQESKRYGKSKSATTVHHIYPVELYPELKYEDWNLISLSSEKHNAMHDRVTNEITELGKLWQERVKDKFIAFYEAKSSPPSLDS